MYGNKVYKGMHYGYLNVHMEREKMQLDIGNEPYLSQQ